MAKKRKPNKPVDSDSIEDLVELAERLSLPEDAFEGDIEDACNDEAKIMQENVESEGWYGKFEFLHLHGFDIGRLKELIEEACLDPDKTKRDGS